jgi:hypothetical protein
MTALIEAKPASYDYQLSFLHNILRRSFSDKRLKNEILQNDTPSKSVPHRISPANAIQVIEFKKLCKNPIRDSIDQTSFKETHKTSRD